MLNRSHAFERQIYRIKELLERSSDSVTWNDHIPDPDSPSHLRQIDVTVRRGNKLTIVECRLSNRRQDVKWVEELLGRKQSLKAETVIAVASAGFTTLAREKAVRYGVILRDLRQLQEEEITSWSSRVSLVLYYFQYSEVTLHIRVSSQAVLKMISPEFVRELESRGVVQAAFNAAANQVAPLKMLATKDETQSYEFRVRIRPGQEVRLSGQRILDATLQSKVRLLSRPVSCTRVLRYGKPEETLGERETTLEQFSLGETSTVHHNDRIATHVDLSDVELPPLSQLRLFEVSSAEDLEHESFSIANPRAIRVAGHLKLSAISVSENAESG